MPDRSYQPSVAGLRAFVSLARKRHFGAAASDLGVSQPSLSQALSALEAGLGTRLVERTTRRVFVTPEGEALLPRAIAVLDAVDELVAAASQGGDPLTGTIRLGMIPTVAPYILPTVLRGLADRLPELTLRVVEDQTSRLLDHLRDGTLDVAVIALPSEMPGMVDIPMYAEDFVLALPGDHPLSGRSRVDPASLADLPLLLLDEGHCLRDQALEVCRLAGVRPDIGHTRAASLATAVQCVEGGLGVTLIPRTAVGVETAGGDLGVANFRQPRPGRHIGLVHRASAGRQDAYRQIAEILTDVVEATGAVRRESV
nr:hydrogen peroxide-inducible genes activator [Gordonia soli]